MKKIILIVFCLIFSQVLFAQKVYEGKIWGKVIKKSSPKEIGNYKYFLTFKQGDKQHAFPIEANKEDLKLLEESIGKTVKIQASILENRKYFDGQPLNFFSVKIQKMKTLSLSDLRPVGNAQVQKTYPSTNGYQGGGGIELPDNVANAAIFAAGAGLIYSILKK
jgi:hypothetical protein